MSDPRHALGLAAEAATERWLVRSGWQVIGRRLRPPGCGEVDLAALDPGGVLVAVEVRARRSLRTGGAAASVDARRIRRLRRALGAIATAAGRPHRGLRIDLVAAEPVPGPPPRWRLLRLPGIG